ncbi:MAG TPA: RDD family protein [Candidatus Acidoferrales bacterium]|nr:RDD family protein [Candidatus Acidoferrales bacterium]
MNCPKCAVEVPPGAESCPACGEPLADSVEEYGNEKAARNMPGPKSIVYAGFWFRAAAYFLDTSTLGFVLGVTVLGPILRNNHVGSSFQDAWKFYTGDSPQATALLLLVQLASWLYFATFESSRWQATPGKKVLGLLVTDLEGKRLSFIRASGRYFGKIISSLLFGIGFVMAGFTEKKQALHDMMAGCLVVRAPSKFSAALK